MSGVRISRRRILLSGASIGAGSLALSGCDAFDDYLGLRQ